MLRSSLVLLVLAFSVSANAEEFDYNYLQLDYTNFDFDDLNVDGDGIGLSGSFAINPDWHVFAGYQAVGLDFGIDANAFNAGIGYNTEMSPTIDAFARFSYEYIELEIPGDPDDDDSGFGFGVGMRLAASEEIEIEAGIDYVDFGSGGDETAFSLGALYSFNDAVALGLGGSWSDDVSAYNLTGRIYFGK
jgi:long-subunit fatty acid transport protein